MIKRVRQGAGMFDSWTAGSQQHAPLVSVLPTVTRRQISPTHRRASTSLKRMLDIVVSAFVLLLLLPAFSAVALAVALDSRGPIFFRQRRTGLNGQIFTILKFRTMTVEEDGDVIAHATRGDKRVTRVGAFLRETSFDELPQLINILRGDMSLVGPRPHALAHDVHYGVLVPRYAERFGVRPGLTGLAQVRGLRGEIRQLDCMNRRVEADADYAANWSFRGDLMIILKTVPMLIRRVNAY